MVPTNTTGPPFANAAAGRGLNAPASTQLGTMVDFAATPGASRSARSRSTLEQNRTWEARLQQATSMRACRPRVRR